jgi:LysM repeat protein
MIAGIALLILVVCAVLFIFLGGGSRLGLGGLGVTPTPTRSTRTTTPAITILPVTLSAPTNTPGPTAATVKYKVKAGDSLIEIAARYKVTVQAIKTANNLKDDTIRVGDELIIPLPTPTPPPQPAASPTPQAFQSSPNSVTTTATGMIHHIVKRGDTLISIAATYGSSVDAIRVYNKLDSDLLSIGQELDVPPGSWSPTPTVAMVDANPTPTAQFAYAAPNLMLPADNAVFRGKNDTPMLAWTAPATLKPNEYYVVHLDYIFNNEKKSIVRQVRQGNSIRLEVTDYPGANFNGTAFSWYVLVVNQTPARAPGQSPQIFAASPASPTWNFVWY